MPQSTAALFLAPLRICLSSSPRLNCSPSAGICTRKSVNLIRKNTGFHPNKYPASFTPLQANRTFVSKITTAETTMSFRAVEKIVVGREQPEGDGARVIRSVGSHNLPNLDPFLLLDELRIRKPAGFPDHPHRGMQTVTYVLEGGVRHEDNKGHVGIIGPGDVQWMTAGRGIVHSEMPEGDSPGHGLQLWVNLAKAKKMTEPQYQELRSSEIPHAKSTDGRVHVKIIAGKCFGVESPVFTETPSMYWDVTMDSNSTFQEKIPTDYNAFMYVLSGTVRVGDKGHVGKHGSCIVFASGASADSIRMTSDKGSRFIVVAGKPLNEPVVQHGPFVMNTREEIVQAFRDFAANKF